MMQWLSVLTTLNMGFAFVCFGLLARANECQRNLEQTFFGAGYSILFITCMMFCVAVFTIIVRWTRNRTTRVT